MAATAFFGLLGNGIDPLNRLPILAQPEYIKKALAAGKHGSRTKYERDVLNIAAEP